MAKKKVKRKKSPEFIQIGKSKTGPRTVTHNMEYQERVYKVSLLLKRKPVTFVQDYIKTNWGVSHSMAREYIKQARIEWSKSFKRMRKAGHGYHLTQMMEIKAKAIAQKDYKLVFEIAKEEAKLMGVYPAEKHKIEETKKIIVIGKKEEEDS
jgi:hypothetical protein